MENQAARNDSDLGVDLKRYRQAAQVAYDYAKKTAEENDTKKSEDA